MSDHHNQALQLATALPIFAVDSAPHLHQPVLDQLSDKFRMPCRNFEYFGMDEAVGHVARALANPDWLCVPSPDRIELLASPVTARFARNAGASVHTLVRIGKDLVAYSMWRIGANERDSAADIDPPFDFAHLRDNPHLWITHRKKTREIWSQREVGVSTWAMYCKHHGPL